VREAWLQWFAGRAAVLYLLETVYIREPEDQESITTSDPGARFDFIACSKHFPPIARRRERKQAGRDVAVVYAAV